MRYSVPIEMLERHVSLGLEAMVCLGAREGQQTLRGLLPLEPHLSAVSNSRSWRVLCSVDVKIREIFGYFARGSGAGPPTLTISLPKPLPYAGRMRYCSEALWLAVVASCVAPLTGMGGKSSLRVLPSRPGGALKRMGGHEGPLDALLAVRGGAVVKKPSKGSPPCVCCLPRPRSVLLNNQPDLRYFSVLLSYRPRPRSSS
jgi:hypothetical protein